MKSNKIITTNTVWVIWHAPQYKILLSIKAQLCTFSAAIENLLHREYEWFAGAL